MCWERRGACRPRHAALAGNQIKMNEAKYYLLEQGPSIHNMVFYFGYFTVTPLLILQTFLAYFMFNELSLIAFIILLMTIFFAEWVVRNFLVKQRPGFICVEESRLTLWYVAGMLRIEYPNSRYELLPSNKKDYLKVKFKNQIVKLSLNLKNYILIHEPPSTFDFIKIKKK